jgi:hypothetical protein
MMSTPPPDMWTSIVVHLRSRTAMVACARIALVVGTILTAINQLDTFVGSHYSAWIWAKVAGNYIVPFSVSSLGYITAARHGRRSPDTPG